MQRNIWCIAVASLGLATRVGGLGEVVFAQDVPDVGPIDIAGAPGEHPRLGQRLDQATLVGLDAASQVAEGERIFSTPFNSLDGLGDNRPTLQNNGRFRRLDGMDSQTCLECHNIASTRRVPARFAVGGVGGVSQTAFPNVVAPDMRDNGLGFADIQGDGSLPARMINPPFVFGSGGVELLGKEMTAVLQRRLADAKLPENDGVRLPLRAKGVSFGFVTVRAGKLDTSEFEGIGEDLVVRPFGRKGCCSTIRVFDTGALPFHHGMVPSETTDPGAPDPDGDGVIDEILPGELSALHIFQTSSAPPKMDALDETAAAGRDLFDSFGCADCHIPVVQTNRKQLPIAFPEEPSDPFDANDDKHDIFARIDLVTSGFEASQDGGLLVPLYADLKLHDMGPRLAEAVPPSATDTKPPRRRPVPGGSQVPSAEASRLFGRTVLTVNPQGLARRLAGKAPRRETDESSQTVQVGPERFFTTARLWGVADTGPYLHDGRAATLTEAILFHGGEAADSQTRFAGASAAQRRQLLAFLRSLRTPTQAELAAAQQR